VKIWKQHRELDNVDWDSCGQFINLHSQSIHLVILVGGEELPRGEGRVRGDCWFIKTGFWKAVFTVLLFCETIRIDRNNLICWRFWHTAW